MHTLTGTRARIRMWTDPDTVEPGALTQLRNCAQLPWTHGVAVMPDVHQGYGATVGSVVAMRDAVSPGAVGVDIGCGMSAVRTDLVANDLPGSLAPARAQVERDVPVGRAGHRDGPPLARLGIDRGWDAFWSGFSDLHHLSDATWTTADKLLAKAHAQQMDAYRGRPVLGTGVRAAQPAGDDGAVQGGAGPRAGRGPSASSPR